jgi:hypothetical protein
MDSQHRLEADDSARHTNAEPTPGRQASFRPWSAQDIASALGSMGDPAAEIDGEHIDGRAQWADFLSRATAAQLRAICVMFDLGGQAGDEDLEPDEDLGA